MSNIPMTRMEEALAIHDKGVGYPSSFVELQGERILMFGMGEFRTSTDGGITWSEPFQAKDDKGEVFLPPVTYSSAMTKEKHGSPTATGNFSFT